LPPPPRPTLFPYTTLFRSLAALAYAAFPSTAGNVAPLLDPGAVSEREVLAPFTFPVSKSDPDLAREAEALASTVKPIYEFQQRALDSATIAMHAFFSAMQTAAGQGGPSAILRLAKDQGVDLRPPEAAYLAQSGHRALLEQGLRDLFERTLALGVTGAGVLQQERAPDLVVRRGASEASVPRDQVLSYEGYLARARAAPPDKGSTVGLSLYIRLADHFFRPTLVPNVLEAERRRDELRRGVDPNKYVVRGGDRIVGAHEVVTNEAHEKLVALYNDLVRRGAATSRSPGGVFGPMLRDALLLGIFWALMVFYRRDMYGDRRQVALVGCLFAVSIVGAGYLVGALALGMAASWAVGAIGTVALLGTGQALVSAGFTYMLLPAAESLTHITTDITLLELSDPSRPLLRRLSLEAPGTYAHSVAMANLVEAACNRIGANGLLGRVGCYYHDIGKIRNPQYFVENQTRGNNPHDRLKPYQSAQIIRAHVTDGIALAREAALPDAVAAFIPEHHGTMEITYFLDRAIKSGDGGPPDPRDYTYPGPRPRSPETAITMLADSVEAALRVLEELTPQKIEEVIDHIVRSKLNGGQLDDV